MLNPSSSKNKFEYMPVPVFDICIPKRTLKRNETPKRN